MLIMQKYLKFCQIMMLLLMPYQMKVKEIICMASKVHVPKNVRLHGR